MPYRAPIDSRPPNGHIMNRKVCALCAQRFLGRGDAYSAPFYCSSACKNRGETAAAGRGARPQQTDPVRGLRRAVRAATFNRPLLFGAVPGRRASGAFPVSHSV